eukprot:m.259058 g.259058  ORF g.259058 m.259058 type:complete len:256 (-) comp22142_c0_seq1:178-945(-)
MSADSDRATAQFLDELERAKGQQAAPVPESRKKTFGTIVAVVCAGATVGLCAALWPFLSPAIRKHCLPYVPATTAQIENVVAACRQGAAPRTIADLGSGDGRIVIALAKQGYRAAGYELNYWLVLYSRWAAYRAGVSRLTSFHRQDLWKADMSKFDAVVIFGVAEMMSELRSKLYAELAPTARVVVCRFPMPGQPPASTIGVGIDRVWTYLPPGAPQSNLQSPGAPPSPLQDAGQAGAPHAGITAPERIHESPRL